MALSGKKCKFKFNEQQEVEGNKKNVEVVSTGQIEGEPFDKETGKGTYKMILVVDDNGGNLREVFATSLSDIK